MMAHHALLFLTYAEKLAIKTHVTTYEHYNIDNGETAYGVPTILSIVFQMMRPNVWVNVFNYIGTIKDVTLASCDNNVVECISKMKMKCINIELNIPGAYNDNKFLMEIYAGALLAKCKTFTNEIQSQKKNGFLAHLPTQDALILPTRWSRSILT